MGDEEEFTPEMLAGAVFKNEPDVVEALLKGGADPRAGQPSAIATAKMSGNTGLLTLLER